jgi:hypothetical protein
MTRRITLKGRPSTQKPPQTGEVSLDTLLASVSSLVDKKLAAQQEEIERLGRGLENAHRALRAIKTIASYIQSSSLMTQKESLHTLLSLIASIGDDGESPLGSPVTTDIGGLDAAVRRAAGALAGSIDQDIFRRMSEGGLVQRLTESVDRGRERGSIGGRIPAPLNQPANAAAQMDAVVEDASDQMDEFLDELDRPVRPFRRPPRRS